MKTLINDPFKDDAVSILEWAYGSQAKWRFIERMAMEQRVGQAFMNTLMEFDQASYTRLAGSFVDPFYVDSKIPAAIDKLTTK